MTRLLMVARTRYALPLSPSLVEKFDAMGRLLEIHVLASRTPGNRGHDPRFTLVSPSRLRPLDGLLFHALLPFRVARAIRRVQPDAILVQGAHETALVLVGRRLAGSRARVILDLHGDIAAPTRLYGSPLRRLLTPAVDALARRGVRGADGVRTLSPFTSDLVRRLGVEPAAEFVAFMDLAVFDRQPPLAQPERPTLLFVGVLERYKALDVIAAAWRLAAARVPEARFHLVGRGTLRPLVESLRAEYGERVRWDEWLDPEAVAAAMDGASALVLASRSEGLGRVIVEAFHRGRPVIGSRAGGIPDAVIDGVSGLLVPPEDVEALADAMTRILADRPLASQLAEGAAAAAARWAATPQEHAARVAALVEAVRAR